MYTFLFDKRSLTMLLGGIALMGLLLFLAGLLVGIHLGLPDEPVYQVAAAETTGGTVPVTGSGDPSSGSVQPSSRWVPLDDGSGDGSGDGPGNDAGDAGQAGSTTDGSTSGGSAPSDPAGSGAGDETSSPSTDLPAPPPASGNAGTGGSGTTVDRPRPAAPRPAVRTAAYPASSSSPSASPSSSSPSSPPSPSPPPSAPPAPSVRGAATANPGYTVQVAAFSVAEYADALLASLEAKGYHAFKAEVRRPGSAVLQAVRLGPFDDRAAAERMVTRLASNEGLEGFVRDGG